MRSEDSLFEINHEVIEIPDELLAAIRIISAGNVLEEGSFNPADTNWELVESQIFWLNLMIDRDPCRLEIRGFPAMRRMPSGRGSGFVKWPQGIWETDIVVERTNEKIAKDRFSLSAKSSIGLISSGGGKYPHRLLSVEGRSREKRDKSTQPQVRFVNALPAGDIRVAIPFEPEPKQFTLEPGSTSEALAIENGAFPGANMDLSLGDAKNQPIKKVPPMARMPNGDWVVIVHLHQESFAAPVLTLVEMDKGSIASPESEGTDSE